MDGPSAQAMPQHLGAKIRLSCSCCLVRQNQAVFVL